MILCLCNIFKALRMIEAAWGFTSYTESFSCAKPYEPPTYYVTLIWPIFKTSPPPTPCKVFFTILIVFCNAPPDTPSPPRAWHNIWITLMLLFHLLHVVAICLFSSVMVHVLFFSFVSSLCSSCLFPFRLLSITCCLFSHSGQWSWQFRSNAGVGRHSRRSEGSSSTRVRYSNYISILWGFRVVVLTKFEIG